MSESLIARAEVVALLFSVNDIAELLCELVALAEGDDGEEEEAD